MTGRYFCPHYNPYSGGFSIKGERHCIVEAQGQWTGRIATSRTDYVPCTGGPARATYFNNRTTTYHEVHRGAVFTSEVSLSGFGSSLSVSAEYGTATRVRYEYPRSRRRHRFCLGGNASTLARSSRLFVTFVKPRSAGGPDCRAVPDPDGARGPCLGGAVPPSVPLCCSLRCRRWRAAATTALTPPVDPAADPTRRTAATSRPPRVWVWSAVRWVIRSRTPRPGASAGRPPGCRTPR